MLCGVHVATFGRMVEVLKLELVRTGKKGGQPKLSCEGDTRGDARRRSFQSHSFKS